MVSSLDSVFSTVSTERVTVLLASLPSRFNFPDSESENL